MFPKLSLGAECSGYFLFHEVCTWAINFKAAGETKERERERENITEFVFTLFDIRIKCFSDFQCGGLFKDLPHNMDLSHLHPFNCSDLKVLHLVMSHKGARNPLMFSGSHDMCSSCWFAKSWPWRTVCTSCRR